MKYVPHDYQQKAKDFILAHPHVGILLDMGLGKTSITLSAIEELMLNRLECETAVVIAPPAVAASTWADEALKWDHLSDLRVVVCEGNPKKRIEALKTPAEVYVISNALVTWLVGYMKEYRANFDILVIDELSAFKSPSSKRFRALKKVRGTFKRIIGLTGTPAPNGLIDLWAQVFLLDGGLSLGRTVTGYREKYFYPVKQNGHVVYEWGLQQGSEDAIYEKLKPFCLSMKNTDYLNMPDRVDNFAEVRMTKTERKQYDYLKKEYCLELKDSEVTASNAAVLSGKLLQLSSGAVYDDEGAIVEIHDKKLEKLSELIEGANGKPIIVVYNYRHSLERIISRFKDDLRLRVYKTPEDKKDWNNGEIDVLLIHPKSCKYGLNLQEGGSTLVWYDLTWSLDDYLQTNARLWRQGQKDTVVIHHIVCKGTIDEKVVKAIQGKQNTQNALLRAVREELKGVRSHS